MASSPTPEQPAPARAGRYRIGVDVGGTFTDVVVVGPDGRLILDKASSTPADPSLGVMDALANAAAQLDRRLDVLLDETERVVHGTTVATNALLERKGARVGLLTTEGHRDVIEMREGFKPDRYDLRSPAPEPLVPRHRRLGVRERLRADGSVATKLDPRSLRRAVAQLVEERVEAVAVCYLHAYRDPAHERATAEALRKALPQAYLSLSSEVLPQIKEFERVSTTVVNAYVGPVVARYLERLEVRLREAGYRGELLVVLSHGGVAPVEQTVRIAAGTVLSGPAGGVAGGKRAAELLGIADLIPFDMGGTSTDISMIVEGQPALSAERSIDGQRVALPSLDIVTLGAGGGSIAHVDAGGVLHVGPASAGADPGPACYGHGGTLATVTDANVLLGYLRPETFHGGRMPLDPDASERALSALGERLGVSAVEAAAGVERVVNTRMAEGIRLVSVRRGVDPRRFALLAFGGAAGVHASALARQLEIGRVIVPRTAAVLSAWGMLASDLRFEVSSTHIGDVETLDAAAVRERFGALEASARGRLGRWFDGEVEIQRSADMRYGEQIFEVDVPLEGVDWDAPDVMGRLAECFHQRHESLFTYAMRDEPVVLVNARVAAIGRLPRRDEPARALAPPSVAQTGVRTVYLDGWREVAFHQLDGLTAGQTVAGPALVESPTTTVLLRATDLARVTELGWLDITVGHERAP